jgi:hypothetical protein
MFSCHGIARLLFRYRRGRPDQQTAITFLSTSRVQAPTVNNQRKLSRVIKYLRKGRSLLVLTLPADNINIVKWWVRIGICSLL